MEVNLLAKKDQLRITLKGRLDEAGADVLRRRVTTANLTAYKYVSIDCRLLDYVSSAGIGTLLSFHSAFHKKGGKVRLENVSQDIHRLLHTLKLDQVMLIEPLS
jgi:anti-anti-sigma factor